MTQLGKQEKQDAAIKEAIVKEENLIFLSLRCEHESASSYLAHMRKNYQVVFGDKEEAIIRKIDFEEFFEKTLQVLIVKGVVFQGLYMYLIETKRGAELLGYGKPPLITSCLLLEQSFIDSRLQSFRYIVPISDEIPDNVGTPCLLCISNDAEKAEISIYYDEPVAGCYANQDDAYAFTALPLCS